MYRTTWLIGFSLVLGVGCTTDNPSYRPTILFDAATGDQRVGDGGGGGSGDMARSDDLTSSLPPDLAKPPPDLTQAQCTGDVRFCNDNKIITCDANQYVVERFCPMGSSCKDASCQPPASNPLPNLQGSTCDSDAGPRENPCVQTLALNLSCQPFVDGNDIVWQCAGIIGAGVPGTQCTTGATCRTGFCGSNGTCFRACVENSDCPNNGMPLECKSVNITVEGQNVSAKSCVPKN